MRCRINVIGLQGQHTGSKTKRGQKVEAAGAAEVLRAKNADRGMSFFAVLGTIVLALPQYWIHAKCPHQY